MGKYAGLPSYSDFIVESWTGISQTIIKYNSFINISGIVLKLPSGYGGTMIATENYWGTQDTGVIDSMIYDKNDDITSADYVDYLPILTEPHSDVSKL